MINETIVDRWIEDNWENVLTSISKLVSIPSVWDSSAARPEDNAPFGPGPRAALTAALDIARQLGLSVTDERGYVGFADLPGSGPKQLGIIGHVDVVPAGPGWHFEPFQVTRKDDYLVGRGVIDDKGPLLCALYAVAFWQQQLQAQGKQFRHSIRVIMGTNEETGMDDVRWYRQHYADPDFLFTPDAEFPVCYGEKGLYGATLTSAPIAEGRLARLKGGAATNAVPGLAQALVRNARLEACPQAHGIAIEQQDENLLVQARGKSAHASLPDQGESAIFLLVSYLLDNNLCSPAEAAFLELVRNLTSTWDGSVLDLACEDADFGKLTVVGGTLSLEGDCMVQTLDARLPTTADPELITQKLEHQAAKAGATLEVTRNMAPFMVDSQAPEVAALIDVYNQVTGETAKPFTMGGATYAREFSRGVSFGPEKPWELMPDWTGSMHGPDEAVHEDLLKEALKIYIFAIERLMELDL